MVFGVRVRALVGQDLPGAAKSALVAAIDAHLAPKDM